MTPSGEHRRIRDALVALAAAHGYPTEVIACGHSLSPRRVREIVAKKNFSAAPDCPHSVENVEWSKVRVAQKPPRRRG